jgi:hypothetical protein
MAVQVLIGNQKGPLPIKASFMAPGDMPMYLEILGSVWTQSANQMIGIQITLDGNVIGTANVFSNGAATHRPVVPVYLPIKLAQGSHTIQLAVAPNTTTVSDLNDLFTAVLHY